MGLSSMAMDTNLPTSEEFLMSMSGPYRISISLTLIMIMDTTSLRLYQLQFLLLGYRHLFFQKQTTLIINIC